jgi:hypothetical protein
LFIDAHPAVRSATTRTSVNPMLIFFMFLIF